MERGVLDAVSINLSNVEVFLHFLDFRRDDVIRSAPDPLRFDVKRLGNVRRGKHTEAKDSTVRCRPAFPRMIFR